MRARGPSTPDSARPQPQVALCLRAAPSSAPRRRPWPHVTLAPLFPGLGLSGTRLTLSARPLASAVSLAAFRPVTQLFLYAGGSPYPTSGRHPFTQFRLFFPADAWLPPVRTRCLPFRQVNGLPLPVRVPGRPPEEVAGSYVLGCWVDCVVARTTRNCQLKAHRTVWSFAALPGKLTSNCKPPREKRASSFPMALESGANCLVAVLFFSWGPQKPLRAESEMRI